MIIAAVRLWFYLDIRFALTFQISPNASLCGRYDFKFQEMKENYLYETNYRFDTQQVTGRLNFSNSTRFIPDYFRLYFGLSL